MIAADRADVPFAPSISRASPQAQPIQGSGYLVIRGLASHTSDDLDRFQAGTPAVLAGGILLDAQFRVLATGPVNQQNDLLVFLIYISNDLRDQDANDALFQTHVGGRQIPNGGKIMRQNVQRFCIRNPRWLIG